MPTVYDYTWKRYLDFANKAEVLAFANKVREAGGANILEALLPSEPGEASACLIANALNFNCSVSGANGRWAMSLPENIDADRVLTLAKAVGCGITWRDINHYEITEKDYRTLGGAPQINLPERIGNAARAFDLGDPEFADLVIECE